jgi:hypothetical protein
MTGKGETCEEHYSCGFHPSSDRQIVYAILEELVYSGVIMESEVKQHLLVTWLADEDFHGVQNSSSFPVSLSTVRLRLLFTRTERE